MKSPGIEPHVPALPAAPTGQAGPTVELRAVADELAARVARGEPLSPEDVRKVQTIGALDLIRSRRPTARARGLEMLAELWGAEERPPAPKQEALEEAPF